MLDVERKQEWKRISVEELRVIKGMEHLTDEEAEKRIEQIEQLSIIIYYVFQNERNQQTEQKDLVPQFKAAA